MPTRTLLIPPTPRPLKLPDSASIQDHVESAIKCDNNGIITRVARADTRSGIVK
jgi:hypothetical protein